MNVSENQKLVTKYSEMTDKEVIKAYQNGDEEAVSEIMGRYKDYIYHISFRFMHNYEDAMDLMQEVLIRMIKGLKRYEDRNYLKGWIYRIISNASINMYKSSSRREIPVDKAFDWVKDSREDVEKSLENTFIKERINESAQKLKGKQRDVFILRYYEVLPYNEIGNILGISPTSAKSNYFYALKKMKNYLEELGVSL